MNYKAILQDLSEHVERVDYRVERGVLMRYHRTPTRVRNPNGTRVGAVSVWGKGLPVAIKLDSGAPSYLKLLENKEFKSVPLLEAAVRREVFRHEARKVFRKYLSEYLSAEIKQLEDDG